MPSIGGICSENGKISKRTVGAAIGRPLSLGISVSRILSENLRTTSLVREHPRLPCVKGAGSRVPRKRETEGLSNLHSQGVPGKRKVLIPSVMALRETAMTAPLGQQGEPLGNGLPLAIIHILIRCVEHHPWSARIAPGGQWPPLQVAIPDFIIDYVPSVPRARAATA